MKAPASERLALVVGAGLLTVGFVAVYAFFVCTELGQWWDAREFGQFQQLPGSDALVRFTRFGIPAVGAFVVAGIAVVALVRRRWRFALPAIVTPLLALAAAEWTKDVLPRPYLGRYAYLENTYPSAHMATTTALAFGALLLCWHGRRRRVIAIVVGAALLVEASVNVKGFAHRPSDVLGGVVLALAIGLAMTALTGARLRGSPYGVVDSTAPRLRRAHRERTDRRGSGAANSGADV